jgi:hypothetical protein
MFDIKYTQFFEKIIRKLTKQELKKMNYISTYPASVSYVHVGNKRADVVITARRNIINEFIK